MIKFAITAAIVLVCLFFIVLLAALMLWVIMKMLRSMFPDKFAPAAKRTEDEV